MAALPSVLTFEDKCPQSQQDLKLERDKYFNWADTYQNPLSEAYKNIESVTTGKSILFHVALQHNWSLRVLAQDPKHRSSHAEIIIPGADLKLAADFSYKLSQQVDLTTPYYYDYITFAIKAPGRQVNPDGFIDVFSSGVWLWLWLSAVICTGLIRIFSFSFITHKFELNLWQSLVFIFKAVISQGHNLKMTKPFVQVLASVWALGAFVASTVYLSVVVSSVLSPDPPPRTPETFDDVVRNGMKPTTMISQYEDVMNYLEGSELESLQKLALNMSKVKHSVNCLDAAVRDTSVVCVAKFRGMQSFLESKYTDKNGQPRILISKYRSPVIWTGFAVRKESPFEGILSSFIDRGIAAGLVQHWTNLADHGRRRWGIGMVIGDRCSNQPHLFELWHKVGNEANKNNPNKHIQPCFRWNLTDYQEIVKNNCVQIDPAGSGGSSFLDSMLRLEHLFNVFKAVLCLYLIAFVCFVMEVVCARLCRNFGHHFRFCGRHRSVCF